MALCAISADPLSVEACLTAVADPGAGGVGLFIGVVRDTDRGEAVSLLRYTAHPSAETELARVCAQVADIHGVTSVAAVHRVGELAVGELAVVVAVSGAHRAEPLAATRELIDEIKARVPIWKEQVSADGRTAWVGLP